MLTIQSAECAPRPRRPATLLPRPTPPFPPRPRRDSDLRRQLADHFTQNLRMDDAEGDGASDGGSYEYEYDYDYEGEYEATEWPEASSEDASPKEAGTDRSKEGAL